MKTELLEINACDMLCFWDRGSVYFSIFQRGSGVVRGKGCMGGCVGGSEEESGNHPAVRLRGLRGAAPEGGCDVWDARTNEWVGSE